MSRPRPCGYTRADLEMTPNRFLLFHPQLFYDRFISMGKLSVVQFTAAINYPVSALIIVIDFIFNSLFILSAVLPLCLCDHCVFIIPQW
jgi:hypothetical protein